MHSRRDGQLPRAIVTRMHPGCSAMTDTTGTLRNRREAVVREHMESENRHEFDATIATFARPRYEIIPTGEIFDGKAAVRGYFAASRAAFPDRRNELRALHHADDAVIVEFDLLGTHLGPLRGVPPTGKAFRCPMTAFLVFESNRIICERAYFDSATILREARERTGPKMHRLLRRC